MKPELIVVTNGYKGNWPAVQYGAWLAKAMQTNLTLVGVVERNDQKHPVEDFFSEAIGFLRQETVNYQLRVHNGSMENLLPQLSYANKNNIFLFGDMEHHTLRKWMSGSKFRAVMSSIASPILYAPNVRLPIKKILICLGGLGYTITAEHLGMQVAQLNQASITLLTVIPPIDLDYPEARTLRENWKKLAETNTLPGKSIREAIETAQKMELKASVHIRNGNVVEEILAEIKGGDYDLVCMGSTYSAHGLRHMLTPNVTAEVAEAIQVPILTARYQDTQEDVEA